MYQTFNFRSGGFEFKNMFAKFGPRKLQLRTWKR